MKISLIAAMAKNRVIGRDNQMPWHLPADLKHFKSVTLGKPVIMGRKTYESIGKALPGRKNIVVSSQPHYQLADAATVTSCQQALELATETCDDVMIIGGGKIYSEFLSQADYLHLTFIDIEVEGDTQFPDWHAYGAWKKILEETHQADDKNPYSYSFVTFERC